MKTFYLVRHCKATGQEPEAELTPEGIAQSKSLSDFLLEKKIEYVISSPFLRAIQSIKPFIEQTKSRMKTDSRLAERILSSDDLLDWMEKLEESFTDTTLKLHGGESSAEAAQRGLEVINEVIQSDLKKVAIVTHGNLMSLIIRNFKQDFGFKEWKSLKNPDVFELIIEQEKHTINHVWE